MKSMVHNYKTLDEISLKISDPTAASDFRFLTLFIESVSFWGRRAKNWREKMKKGT